VLVVPAAFDRQRVVAADRHVRGMHAAVTPIGAADPTVRFGVSRWRSIAWYTELSDVE